MYPFSTIRRLTAERDHLTCVASGLLREVIETRAKLAQGHFRNPKMGRLGVKGQTFD